MSAPFFQIRNIHDPSCGKPPAFSNETPNKYLGYFENRFGEQWVFVYDRERDVGELRGGDAGWNAVFIVKDGKADVVLGIAETAWLQACWQAAAGKTSEV